MTDISNIQPDSRGESSNMLNPVLLFGMGRSGTTLVMQLLGTSGRIAFDRVYPFEVRYLTYLLRWALLLEQQWQPDQNWNSSENFNPPGSPIGAFPYIDAELWNGKELWPSCFASAWQAFSTATICKTRQSGKPGIDPAFYAEKIPLWVLEYLALQPVSYKIILLMRDPRDIFLSINAFDKQRGFAGFNRKPSDSDWDFARRLVASFLRRMKFIRHSQAAQNCILVKYEQLAIDLPMETQRLSQWLGTELDANEVKKKEVNLQHHMTSASPEKSVERWRRELSSELNEFFLKELGDELRSFGYES